MAQALVLKTGFMPALADQLIVWIPIRLLFFIIGLFYAFGAVIHLLTMLGLIGDGWDKSPPLWRVMDVVFLGLNLTVVIGVLSASGWAIFGFLVSAGLHIGLYTLLPGRFAATPREARALGQLVILHIGLVSLFLVLMVARQFWV